MLLIIHYILPQECLKNILLPIIPKSPGNKRLNLQRVPDGTGPKLDEIIQTSCNDPDTVLGIVLTL